MMTTFPLSLQSRIIQYHINFLQFLFEIFFPKGICHIFIYRLIITIVSLGIITVSLGTYNNIIVCHHTTLQLYVCLTFALYNLILFCRQ